MTLKGYYPSMSLGFEILLGVINVVAGCTLAVIGAMVVFNKSDVLCGFVYLGVAAIMAGAFVATAGGLAFFGSCREHVPSLRIVRSALTAATDPSVLHPLNGHVPCYSGTIRVCAHHFL